MTRPDLTAPVVVVLAVRLRVVLAFAPAAVFLLGMGLRVVVVVSGMGNNRGRELPVVARVAAISIAWVVGEGGSCGIKKVYRLIGWCDLDGIGAGERVSNRKLKGVDSSKYDSR